MFRVRVPARQLAAAALLLALASPSQAVNAPAIPAPDWTAPHAPGQLIIKLPETTAAAAQAQLSSTGARVVNALPQVGLALVEVAPDQSLADAAADLLAAGAAWAEPNYTFNVDLTPNDPSYAAQEPYLTRMSMPAAWDLTTGRPEIIVAILDTGIDLAHPDLSPAIWLNADEIPDNDTDDDGNGFTDDVHGWDFAENDNLPDDNHGHGTHVAGIAGARINNGTGIAGMAGEITLMPVDVFKGGIGAYADLIQAIIYATDNGAHVINMSLGASSYSRGEQMAVDYAWAHGVVVVAAAGNTGSEQYHYPAAHTHTIAVGATNSTDVLASFSTRGDFVDVAAPGVSIYSTYPGGYRYLSGTSMAAPHVSGLAALILSRDPTLTPDAVRALIEDNAVDLGAYGWDNAFGHGRIDAYRALAATTPRDGPAPPPASGPPLEAWPAGCQELITDGSFEAGAEGWVLNGNARIDATQAYSGTQALLLPGGTNARSAVTRTVTLAPFSRLPTEGALWFAYRIETGDWGQGTRPDFPYDDWLTAEFRSMDGQVISSLLRTGNTADTAGSGLPWDRYYYRMQTADLRSLGMSRTINLVFTAANDADNAGTSFWIDEVRFCVKNDYGQFLILIWRQ